MRPQSDELGCRYREAGLLAQFAGRGGGEFFAGFSLAFRDIPARRARRMPQEDALAIPDDHPAARPPGFHQKPPLHARAAVAAGDAAVKPAVPAAIPGILAAIADGGGAA